MKSLTLFLLWIVPALGFAQSGQSISFSGVNVIDDGEISLADFKSKPGVVVIFIGYKCPFDDYYRLRISELISSYSGRIPFLLINSYLEPDEAVDKMKMEAVALGYKVPYLADKEQKIMSALGARKTPEAFVLKRTNDTFSIVYSGAIDDNPQLPAGVSDKYLADAIGNLLEDKPAIKSVRATGCTIRQR